MSTKMLTVRCPYRKPADQTIAHRTLMNVYFNRFVDGDEDEEQTLDRIAARGLVRNVRAVEIFDNLDTNQGDSIFLTTVEDDSQLDFRGGQILNCNPPDARLWEFSDETGGKRCFQPLLVLNVDLRCVLFKKHIDVKIHFNNPDGRIALENRFDNITKCEIDDEDKDGRFRVSDLLLSGVLWQTESDNDEQLPKLLEFEHFAPEVKNDGERRPKGFSFWTFKFAAQNPASKKHTLEVAFERRKDGAEGWGETEQTATKLFPLNIAPLGVGERQADISLIQTYPGENLLEWINKKETLWKMKVRTPERALGNEIDETDMTFTPLGAWNRFVANRHYQSLRSVKDGTPGSIVPFFKQSTAAPDSTDETVVWVLHYDLTDADFFAEDVSEKEFDFKLRGIDFENKNNDAQTLKVSEALNVEVELFNFRNHEGKPVTRRLRLSNLKLDPDTENPVEKECVIENPLFAFTVFDKARIQTALPSVAPLHHSRVGSLDLGFAPFGDEQTFKGKLIVGLENLELLSFPEFALNRFATVEAIENNILLNYQPRICAEIFFHLVSLNPGGQDPTLEELTDKNERSLSTVIIMEKPIEGAFVLVATEENEPQENQSLELRLEKNKGVQGNAGNNVDFVILDQKPFLLARVSANINFNDEIGNWKDTESFWELSDKDNSFRLLLPPQAVGEEFIKGNYEDFDKNKTLFYKFSPPARFELARSLNRQNFTESPWNLRRLFGFIKGKDRGMEAKNLQFELLFGLQTTVVKDFLRVSELNDRLGYLAEKLDEDAPLSIEGKNRNDDIFIREYKALSITYQRQRRSLQRRLALIYLWLLADKERLSTLRDGLNFEFRSGREVVHPTQLTKREPDTTDPNILKTFLPEAEGGLRGGADWGFESANIHKKVITTKSTDSSFIVAPSFTALGGNGYQKAAFDNDKSAIFSNTFLGRTFFYSLERIGRISSLWNRAKHVIIYERSVVDSEQFKDKDENWRGRVVGRKLREFVEILQPERNYPEFGEPPKVCGFVLASRFQRDAKINVDSKWGNDIPDGWVVPLYNPAAEQLEPKVYPKPEIDLRTSTSENTGKAQTWGRIKNPQILYFYTSTAPNTGVNTDEWEAVPEIDFPLEDIPVEPPNAAGHVPGALDAKLPDPPSKPGGYERFTFELETTGQTTNLLANRAGGVTEAVIENVTMVRRSLRKFEFDPANALRSKLGSVLNGEGADFRREVENQLSNTLTRFIDLDEAALVREIESLKASLQRRINEIGTAYNNLQSGAAALTTLKIFQEAQNNLETKWKDVWKQTRPKILEGIRSADSFNQAHELLFDLRRQIAAAEFAFNETQMKVAKVFTEIDNFRKKFPVLQTDFIKFVRQAVEGVTAGDLEALRKYRVAMMGEITRLHLLLRNLRSRSEGLLPNFWQGLETAASRLIEKLAAPGFDDLERWLREVEAALEMYRAWIDNLHDAISGIRTEIDNRCNKFAEILQGEIDRIKRKLEDEIQNDINRLKDEIEEILANAEKVVRDEFFGKARTVFDETNNEFEIFRDRINQAHGRIEQAAAAARAEIEAVAAIARQAAVSLGDDLTAETHRAIQDFTAAAVGNAAKVLAPYEQKLRDEIRRIDLTGDLQKAREIGDRTLRLVRAHGLAPVAQAMQLNRDRLNYYFNEARDLVDFTPATVLVNRIGRELENLDLKTLGIRLPSRQLGEKFISDTFKDLRNNLPRFDLREILPDFAGLNLEKLFDGVRIPEYASDAIKITHGINEQTRTAWAQCDVAFPFDRDITFFELGPVTARLVKAHFEAHTRIQVSPFDQNKTEQEANGAISADWQLMILGQTVLTLEKCTLRFDKSGRLKFEMQPSSVKLPSALQFLTDLVKSFNPGKKSGLSFELMTDGGLPIGVRALLSLPIPPLQTGAFAVSHIALRARFEAAAPGGKFYVGFGMSLSSKERPFTLTILCLGGGGWFDSLAIYRPFEQQKKITAKLSIGLAAGADFSFDIGVAAGTVYFLVSFYADYTLGGGSHLRLALRVAVGGEVSILGIVTVGIELALEASYETGGTLRCTGRLSVSIEICWCFTLEVEQDVEFVLAGSGGSSPDSSFAGFNSLSLAAADAHNPINTAVDEYIAAFGG